MNFHGDKRDEGDYLRKMSPETFLKLMVAILHVL